MEKLTKLQKSIRSHKNLRNRFKNNPYSPENGVYKDRQKYLDNEIKFLYHANCYGALKRKGRLLSNSEKKEIYDSSVVANHMMSGTKEQQEKAVKKYNKRVYKN